MVAALLVGVVPANLTGPVSAASVSTASVRSGPQERGTWTVVAVGDGRYQVSWTSPVRLPVTSDRPRIVSSAGTSFGAPTVAFDRRTVRATATSATVPSPEDLDVVLSGDRLDVAGNDARTVTGGSPTASLAKPVRTLTADPGTPGDFAVVRSDYELDPVKLAGMPEPIEMVGHVVEPDPGAVTGPRPLVLFLHGRHDYCYQPGTRNLGFEWPCVAPFEEIPSHLGYDYIQRLLASQGYATVSVRVNGINAQDFRLPDGGAGARAEIVRDHLDYWATMATEHQLDLARVVLVGHSRGGEGVDRASIEIPLSAPYRIVGQVLIAPTDFANQTAPYVPTVTLLPYCDGDVSDLQGQKFTDSARDLTTADTSLKSSVLIQGANHNFFNTEWTPGISAAKSFDDWSGEASKPCGKEFPSRLTAHEQRAVGAAYVAGAVHLFAGGEQEFLPMYDGSRVTVASVGDADVRTHAIGGGRTLRRPSLDSGLSLASGAQTQFCSGVTDFENSYGLCGRSTPFGLITPHWPSSYEQIPTKKFFEMSWTSAGQSGGMVLERTLDLSARRLELRTIVDPVPGDVSLRVRVTDADGASAELTPEGGSLLPALLRGTNVSKLWAQTIVVDPSPASAAGVDVSRIERIDLIGDSSDGRIWVADLAAAPASLAAVPDRRLPTINLSDLRLVEGAGRGTVTAQVPFTVSGDVSRPARFVVVTTGQERGSLQHFAVDLSPGQTSGSIPVDYESDRRDDFPRTITQVATWASREVMTDNYLGELAVLDDDPTPPITVTPVSKTVQEGEPISWSVRLGARVDYDLFVAGKVVRGPKPELSGDDVPADWLATHAWNPDEVGALHTFNVHIFEQLRSGERTLIVSIPTRSDGAVEGRESITVRFKIDHTAYTRTIHVAPSN